MLRSPSAVCLFVLLSACGGAAIHPPTQRAATDEVIENSPQPEAADPPMPATDHAAAVDALLNIPEALASACEARARAPFRTEAVVLWNDELTLVQSGCALTFRDGAFVMRETPTINSQIGTFASGDALLFADDEWQVRRLSATGAEALGSLPEGVLALAEANGEVYVFTRNDGVFALVGGQLTPRPELPSVYSRSQVAMTGGRAFVLANNHLSELTSSGPQLIAEVRHDVLYATETELIAHDLEVLEESTMSLTRVPLAGGVPLKIQLPPSSLGEPMMMLPGVVSLDPLVVYRGVVPREEPEQIERGVVAGRIVVERFLIEGASATAAGTNEEYRMVFAMHAVGTDMPLPRPALRLGPYRITLNESKNDQEGSVPRISVFESDGVTKVLDAL